MSNVLQSKTGGCPKDLLSAAAAAPRKEAQEYGCVVLTSPDWHDVMRRGKDDGVCCTPVEPFEAKGPFSKLREHGH